MWNREPVGIWCMTKGDQPSSLWGKREVQEGGGIFIYMAGSCWCIAETNPILQSNYPPIKKNFFKTFA